ncbi:MAG: ATP-dependent Clp protease adaptor ClpS [Armatimonadota bacterium]
MASQTELLPRPELGDEERTGGEWIVIVLDNDHNTWDEVILILQKATGCTLEEAQMETWEVHHLGRSIVHHADQEECARVAGIIRTIGIQVEVEQL